ncbi:very short patch repair endonuclease [Stenotrophomonas sp. GD03930]|uniref:very short patch repair endonuclease n=1 Tax=Stenotrophomonas sp. GD03930 TaxID=2975406 RepID=UPI00244C0D7A|nr:very short patch repair endonuclease [Stenotrophomonas sp. GD03930]MDH1231568.1 very short patch repair endonuclease [Stenotrophomonas sp. GD03930]
MVDVVSKEVRQRMMSKIRGKDTGPELLVRRFLHSNGFRYSLHKKQLPGTPDLVLRRYHLSIFVHGCFWHHHLGCRYATIPQTRTKFWLEKLNANRKRDELAQIELQKMGWRSAVVWECALKKSPQDTLRRLKEFVRSSEIVQEFTLDQRTSVE